MVLKILHTVFYLLLLLIAPALRNEVLAFTNIGRRNNGKTGNNLPTLIAEVCNGIGADSSKDESSPPFTFEDKPGRCIVSMPIGEDIHSKDINYKLENNILTLGIKGKEVPVIDSEQLQGKVLADDSYWEIEEIGGRRVELELTKSPRDLKKWDHLLQSQYTPTLEQHDSMLQSQHTPTLEQQAGAYVGYTLGDQNKPSLYFEGGHLTQEHNDPDNVGWHPVLPGTYEIRKNVPSVDGLSSQLVELICQKGTTERLCYHQGQWVTSETLTIFTRSGPYEQPAALEVELPQAICVGLHVSRSKLFPPNEIFDTKYAMEELKTSKMANNEEQHPFYKQ